MSKRRYVNLCTCIRVHVVNFECFTTSLRGSNLWVEAWAAVGVEGWAGFGAVVHVFFRVMSLASQQTFADSLVHLTPSTLRCFCIAKTSLQAIDFL